MHAGNVLEFQLQPGVSIKPKVDENEVKNILSGIYGLKCVSIKQLNGYDDFNFHVKVSDECDNENIKKINKDGYILKVINSLDSQRPQFFEAQNEVLRFLGKTSICCPQPVQNKSGEFYIIRTFSSGKHIVRLLEFIAGSILHQVPTSVNLFYKVGKFAAQLDQALKKFHHPAYDCIKSVWHLESAPQLSKFLYVITDETRKKIVSEVIEDFPKRVLAAKSRLEKGVIHGDFNEQNILVDEKDNELYVKAILDFGDSQFGCYIYELAIAMAYMMIQGKSIEAGGYVLAGYNSVRKISDEEYNLLKTCIAARMSQSLVLGVYTSIHDPDNPYILTTAKTGWALLVDFWSKPESELLEVWKKIVDETADWS
ncbi:hydroxylysine kinase [Tribolium castaneum]|uniref:hydroxylysine kinase n=1 Tax=Tribolium castaneum TaxID=7070 RepID=UPI0000D569B1|nr:PREDICTED: hydroxylysine kinase [Tribolium castaneum]|eukprot:XP_975012.1 PREDICTED: hydroxylysine kinase [Tribolium castaneum]